jgi:CheY-like chemotaxis protein
MDLDEKNRVLVMDDEEIIRDLFRDMLHMLGYESEVVSDGQTAIASFSRAKEQGSPFAKVILDLTVPYGLGGEETMRELRKIDPAVKAIVSSGFPNDPVIVNYKEYGFQAALLKPYHLRDLKESLRKLD